MHMDDASVGRAIYPDAAPSPSVQSGFSAKEEAIQGSLARELASLGIKDLRIVSASGERMLYSRDQSDIPRFLSMIMFNVSPDVVVQPGSREAVSSILRFAASKGVTAIPRGSASSPFGGSVPVRGGIVVDMSAMNKIIEIDAERGEARVETGVRWADLDQELEKKALTLNSSPSSKFSTVGGWIATGGIGLNSFSKGRLSKSVLSVELVTPDGAIRELSKLDPEFQAVFGSEGQLGVVTAATILVRSKPKISRPHLVFFDDYRSAFAFARGLAGSTVHPSHIIFESSSKFALIDKMLGKGHFPIKEAILVNVEGDAAEQSFQSFLKTAGLEEEKEYLARYMWNERYFPMKIRRFGPGLLGSEVLVPLDILPDAIEKSMALCCELDLKPIFEVHFLDDGRGLLLCFYVTDQGNIVTYTMDAVKSMLITARLIQGGAKPYSIGVWFFPFSDAEEKDRVRRLLDAKKILDPQGVMNTGKYFSLSGRFGGLGGLAFSPKFMKPAFKTMLLFLPITSRVMRSFGSLSKSSKSNGAPRTAEDLERIANECAMCGACVSVCPAYLIVRDERVTARGKLMTATALARGERLSKEHSDRTFLCMRCKACEQVCQSKLELVNAYDVLEKELERLHGKDLQEIERFIKYAEASPEYDKLIERGLVIGAPKHGMGDDTGV
jgi:FAD/FMN-containing dehydrogenase/ferredoxin